MSAFVEAGYLSQFAVCVTLNDIQLRYLYILITIPTSNCMGRDSLTHRSTFPWALPYFLQG